MSKIVIQVNKNKNETPSSLIRRFNKRVQEAGTLKAAKSKRYKERNRSEYVKKKHALRRIGRRTEIEKLKRLGKIVDAPYKNKR